jgi:hypothetical protein
MCVHEQVRVIKEHPHNGQFPRIVYRTVECYECKETFVDSREVGGELPEDAFAHVAFWWKKLHPRWLVWKG